jgi:hypothetical protein
MFLGLGIQPPWLELAPSRVTVILTYKAIPNALTSDFGYA